MTPPPKGWLSSANSVAHRVIYRVIYRAAWRMPDAGRALGLVRLCCALRPWHRDGFQREPGGANMKHTKEQRDAYRAAIDAVFRLVGALGDGPEHEAAQQA